MGGVRRASCLCRGTGGAFTRLEPSRALLLSPKEALQGFDRDLQLGAVGLGCGEVPLEEVADGDGWAGLAEDEPGLGDKDELHDGVAPPVDERVEQGDEDYVTQDVRSAAGVDAVAPPRPFKIGRASCRERV